jgi:hypothetical protein
MLPTSNTNIVGPGGRVTKHYNPKQWRSTRPMAARLLTVNFYGK